METVWTEIIASYWPVAAGAGAGYAYHRLIGCRSGACIITANPWISTLYGAFLGALLV